MTRFVLCLLCSVLFAGAAPAEESRTLVIPGTGDSQELLREIAARFESVHSGVTVDIPDSIGSSGGIRKAARGEAVLARVARQLKPEERQAGLHSLVFAFSPVVFAAHLQRPCLQGLNAEHIVGIFSGRLTDWSELGDCPPHVIYVANREPGDSSRTVIEDHLPEFESIKHPAGETIYSTPETVQILERYPHTIGYVPRAAVKDSALTVLAYEGTAPTPANVRTGRYPLVVSLTLVWLGEPSPLARLFIDYLMSGEGQEVIRSFGLVPAQNRRD